MTTHHISTNIDSLLKWSDKKLNVMFDLPGHEVRLELKQRKANGERLIGCEGCEGFSPVTGCPGHENK